MLLNLGSVLFYGAAILSLFIVDHFLGNGFLDMSQRIFCKVICSLRKTVIEEINRVSNVSDVMTNVPVLIIEVIILSLTMNFLKRYKRLRYKDRIDILLEQSKDALRQTNQLLDKWHSRHVSTNYSYLDDEPNEIKHLKVEVPILQMAIVDSLGTSRSKPERRDAGDTINITESTLFSMTSLSDDDLEPVIEVVSQESTSEEKNDIKFENRCHWNGSEDEIKYLENHSITVRLLKE